MAPCTYKLWRGSGGRAGVTGEERREEDRTGDDKGEKSAQEGNDGDGKDGCAEGDQVRRETGGTIISG